MKKEKKAHKIINKVLKTMGVSVDCIDSFDGRYIATDGFVTVMVAKEGSDISLWPKAHIAYVNKKYDKIKAGLYSPNEDIEYDVLMAYKLKKCMTKPVIHIEYETVVDGFEVVVYTDTTDSLVEQAELFKGK